MTGLEGQIQTAAELIREAHYPVALTGAGISTPSGIPDFRSPHSGLWQKTDPMQVASIMAFRRSPAAFFEWVRPLAKTILQAKPNAAHQVLADLEGQGYLKAIITQNIDSLHQAAGSQVVIEVHGHIRSATCIRCYKIYDSGPILEKFLTQGKIPICDCDQKGILKPDVILFGEQLPVQAVITASNAVEATDLMLVIGSSLEVAPVSDMPYQAWQNGAKLIIINYEETYLDQKADLVIHRDVIEVLPRIGAIVMGK